jgi:hypothetical protein
MDTLAYYRGIGAELFPLARYRAGDPKSKQPRKGVDWRKEQHPFPLLEKFRDANHLLAWRLWAGASRNSKRRSRSIATG